jgi:hypothetical protein
MSAATTSPLQSKFGSIVADAAGTVRGRRKGAPGDARKNLVDPEMAGDSVDAQEPKDKQRDSERADERECGQAEAHHSVEHEPPRAAGQPSGSYVPR